MATRTSGQLKLSVIYRDAGHYTGTISHNGRTLYRATLNPPASGFGRGVAYDSPEAYDATARSLLGFGIAESDDVASLAEYDTSGNPAVVRGAAEVGRGGESKRNGPSDEIFVDTVTSGKGYRVVVHIPTNYEGTRFQRWEHFALFSDIDAASELRQKVEAGGARGLRKAEWWRNGEPMGTNPYAYERTPRRNTVKRNGGGSALTPDAVTSYLEGRGFREVEQATDVDGDEGIVSAGFSAYYPTASSTQRANHGQVVVTHFVRGEKARPTAKQAATKATMVKRMAKALRDGGFAGVTIASNGRRLTVAAGEASASKRNGNVAYLEDINGNVFTLGDIVVKLKDVLWSSPDGRIIAAKIGTVPNSNKRYELRGLPTYAVIDRAARTCSEPATTNKQVAINNAIYVAIQVRSVVPTISMAPCERQATKRNGRHSYPKDSSDANEVEAAELVSYMMNDDDGWRKMQASVDVLAIGDARSNIQKRVEAAARSYRRENGMGSSGFNPNTLKLATSQIVYQMKHVR